MTDLSGLLSTSTITQFREQWPSEPLFPAEQRPQHASKLIPLLLYYCICSLVSISFAGIVGLECLSCHPPVHFPSFFLYSYICVDLVDTLYHLYDVPRPSLHYRCMKPARTLSSSDILQVRFSNCASPKLIHSFFFRKILQDSD